MISDNAIQQDSSGIDQILAKLGSADLAGRIAEAARMAMANHLKVINQQMHAEFEAEYSKQQ
jgi:hypothetical protein